jgi:hypothetical protein
MNRQRHGIAIEYPSGAVMCQCGATYSDHDAARDHFAEVNGNPALIQGAEQLWAEASDSLDNLLTYIRSQLPELYATAGGNTDPSVVFDYMKSYISHSERSAPGIGHLATVLFAAAAITRLVSAPLTNDVLAQLDKDMETGNDDH